MNYRHGDVDIREVKESEVPKNLKKLDTLTLAFGEATGHHHTLVAEPMRAVVFEDEKGQKWVRLDDKAELTHQEHKTLTIEKGWYLIQIEQEFDPFKDAIQKVRD